VSKDSKSSAKEALTSGEAGVEGAAARRGVQIEHEQEHVPRGEKTPAGPGGGGGARGHALPRPWRQEGNLSFTNWTKTVLVHRREGRGGHGGRVRWGGLQPHRWCRWRMEGQRPV
jgi:hypothetical protein